MIAVSVLIPVYNAEKYIRKCLDSVVNQTLENKEVIVIDDGSTDRSPQIIDEYTENYEFIHSYHQENMGVVKTRCKLLSLARGQYIAWIDSDDFMEKNMLEQMYQAGINENAELIMCDYEFFPNSIKNKKKWYKPYKGLVDWHFIERNTQQWNKLVRRTLLEQINMVKWMAKGGEGAYALVLIKANGIVSIDEPLYHYSVGHTSLSNNYNNIEWYANNVDKTKQQLQAAVEIGLSGEWVEYFEYRIIYSLTQLMIIAALTKNRDEYKFAVKELRSIHWRKNRFTAKIFNENHGRVASFAIRNMISLNFDFAHIVTNLVLQ